MFLEHGVYCKFVKCSGNTGFNECSLSVLETRGFDACSYSGLGPRDIMHVCKVSSEATLSVFNVLFVRRKSFFNEDHVLEETVILDKRI